MVQGSGEAVSICQCYGAPQRMKSVGRGSGRWGWGRSREGPRRYILVGGPPGCAGPQQRRPLAGSRGVLTGTAQARLRDAGRRDERQKRKARPGWAKQRRAGLDWGFLGLGLAGSPAGWLAELQPLHYWMDGWMDGCRLEASAAVRHRRWLMAGTNRIGWWRHACKCRSPAYSTWREVA